MRTALMFYFDLWRGPIMSNKSTNDLMDFLLDTLFPGKNQTARFTKWFWDITDFPKRR